jgi:hypothetical protein
VNRSRGGQMLWEGFRAMLSTGPVDGLSGNMRDFGSGRGSLPAISEGKVQLGFF